MRRWIAILFLASPSWAVAPVITQSTPIINQGTTFQFTETASEAGTWACSATNSTGGVTSCTGSITSGGLYTAPSSVTAQHVWGGVQIGPNNDVFNTRIDSMPVSSSNTLYMNTVNQGGVPNWQTVFPMNYVTSANTDSMNFYYTTGNNGTFEVPKFPNAQAENGWFDALQLLSGDHHVVMADSTTGNLSEFYQYYPNCITTAASVTGNIATLTCSKNPQANEFLVGSTVSVGGFSGSDTYFNVASTTLTSVNSTSISYKLVHANASASTNGAAGKNWSNDSTGLDNSQGGILYSSMSYLLPTKGTTDAAGMELQPLILGVQEFERAYTKGEDINHAMRLTFGVGYEASASTWPATAFAVDGGTVPFGARVRLKAGYNISGYSPQAQVLLRQLQHYGAFNTDGGQNWPMNAELTRWPKFYYDALTEVANGITASSMEFVNESGMMLSTASALTTNNREIITFTRTSDSALAITDVLLQGPALNFQNDAIYIMAGTPATQIPVLNNFGGYSCSMSPSTGTLTSGCLYTPPAVLNVSTTTTITATSLINSSMTATTTLTVFASTGIYVVPSQTSNYTDTLGNTWTARSGISNVPDNQGCCSCDNESHFSGTDVSLYECVVGISSIFGGDTQMNFYVPNGTYQVVYHYGTQDATGTQFIKYAVGSTEILSNSDPSVLAGGQYQFFTSTNTTVTNNLLQVGVYQMNQLGAPVSSLSLVRTGNSPNTLTESWSGQIKATGRITAQ